MSQMNALIEGLRRAALLNDGAGRTDGQLLTDYLNRRNVAALEAIVRRHAPMVWGVCRRILRNEPHAEDAFQATFVVLVRRAGAISPRELVGNWLYGVAVQTALKARATSAKRSSRERQVALMPDRITPDRDEWQELQPVLDLALKSLPEKYRSVIVLCDLEGRTRNDAARQLGVPEGTVAGRLARARTLLAKRLAQRGVSLSVGALAALLSNQSSAATSTAALLGAIRIVCQLSAAPAATTGVMSVSVVALAEGVMTTMALTKTKLAATALITLALFSAGGFGMSYFVGAAPNDPAPTNPQTSLVTALVAEQPVDPNVDPKPAGPRIEIGSDIVLLYQHKIQKELRLTDEQKKMLPARLDQFVALRRGVEDKVRGLSAYRPEQLDPILGDELAKLIREQPDQWRKPVTAAGNQIAADLLSPTQQKRLQQIVIREAGIRAFGRDDLQQSLALTKEQRERIAAIGREYGKAYGNLFDAAPGRSVPTDALRELSQQFAVKAAAVLNESQASVWKDLIGEPFDDKPAEPVQLSKRSQLHSGGAGSLLRFEDVIQELKLTEEQSRKAAAGAAELDKKKIAHTVKMEGLSGAERIVKEEEGHNAIDAEGDKLARELLTPPQLERLKQIEIQHLGFAALFRESVEQALQLSDEQKRAILAIDRRHEAADSKLRREAGRNANSPETRGKLRELNRAALSEAMASFTDLQKETWKKLMGAPFEIQWPPRLAAAGPRPAEPGALARQRPLLDKILAPDFRPGVRTTLLARKAVQDDLKLSEEQLQKLTERLSELQKLVEVTGRQRSGLPRDLPITERLQKQAELSKPLMEAEEKAIADILTKGQQARFRQIELQIDGPRAFGREEVVRALKLSDEQIDKIARIVIGHGNAMVAAQRAPRDGKAAPYLEKMRSLSREYVEKAVALLNDEQKKTWKEMVGEPHADK